METAEGSQGSSSSALANRSAAASDLVGLTPAAEAGCDTGGTNGYASLVWPYIAHAFYVGDGPLETRVTGGTTEVWDDGWTNITVDWDLTLVPRT